MTDVTELNRLEITAMRMAKQHGTLVRWPGGFWTYPQQMILQGHKDVTPHPPSWYVRPNIIKRLLYKKLLKVVEKHPAGFATKVIPT